MPPRNVFLLSTVRKAVGNVLTGRNADGSLELKCSPSFTKDADARDAAAKLLTDVITGADAAIRPEHFTPLTCKLLTHLSRAGLQSTAAIEAFESSTLADALRESPDVLLSKAGITAILRKHATLSAQAAAKMKRGLLTHVPLRRMLWASGRYTLCEALDHRHLQQDSATLHHCVGTLGVGRSHEALMPHYLHYWARLKSSDCRIFTLMDEQPVATVEYDVRERCIKQIRGLQNKRIGLGHPAFPALCAALDALRNDIPLVHIADLPTFKAHAVLTPSGTICEATPEIVRHALSGRFLLKRKMSDAVLDALCANPLLTLDTTGATEKNLARLRHVRCNLVSFDEAFCLPSLISSQSIRLTKAATVSLPMLRNSGNNAFTVAVSVDMPMLLTSGENFFPRARRVSMPNLEVSGDNAFGNAVDVDLPALKHSDANIFEVARSVFLPSLISSGTNLFTKAKTVSMPALVHSGLNSFDSAVDVHMPALITSGDNAFPVATRITLTALRTSGNNTFLKAPAVSLPNLCSCGVNTFTDATAVDLSRLHTSGDNIIPLAASPSLPCLKTSGDNFFPSAASVYLPALESSGNNHFGMATAVSVPMLTVSGHNIFHAARDISLPALLRSGNNIFSEARRVSMPLLYAAGLNSFPKAETLFLPSLRRAELRL